MKYEGASEETRDIARKEVETQGAFDLKQGVYSLGKELLKYAQLVRISRPEAEPNPGVANKFEKALDGLFLTHPR